MYIYFKYFKGREQIIEITTGSAQPKFNKTAFRNLVFNCPENVILKEFNRETTTLFNLININNEELRLLNDIANQILCELSRR